jgi:DNA-binding NarL/FixJ family response regulator
MRVIIADDHALFRQGLKSLLLLQPNLEVVAEVARASELDQVLAATPCDVLLLDLQMDEWAMDKIPALSRHTIVIVLTASESAENGAKALRLGARAIVQKRFAIETLMLALHACSQGSVWMPPEVQAELAGAENLASRELTPRETEVVRYVALGLRNAEVAERLAIAEATVKTHLNNVFQKLGMRDRLELVHYAIRTGLVTTLERDREAIRGGR